MARKGDAVQASPALPLVAPREGDRLRLSLLGGFSLTVASKPIELSTGSRRVLALLALVRRPLGRATVAGMLKPDAPEPQASANLRSALWRLGKHRHALVVERGQQIQLREVVRVDHAVAQDLGRRILSSEKPEAAGVEIDLFASDLLPDWSEEWLDIERERFRQLRLHVLETLCGLFVRAHRYGPAVEAALLATTSEPLRETAQRALITAYLAEGNRVDALRQYRAYRDILREELDLEPSPEIRDTIHEIRTA